MDAPLLTLLNLFPIQRNDNVWEDTEPSRARHRFARLAVLPQLALVQVDEKRVNTPSWHCMYIFKLRGGACTVSNERAECIMAQLHTSDPISPGPS